MRTSTTPSPRPALPPPGPEELARRGRRFGVWYFAEHQLLAMRSYLSVIVAFSVGHPLLYLVAMGVGLASLVDANGGGDFGGVDYLVFIVPALLATGAFMAASGEFTWPIMDGFKWHRLYYGPLVSPLQPWQIAAGHTLAVAIRLFSQSLVYYLIVAAFGAVPSGFGILSVVTATLAGLAIGTPLMAYAATIREEKAQFVMIQRFGVMPLMLFSGTFFPLTNLPVFLQWIGWLSPLWHASEIGRVFSYGYDEPLWLSIAHVAYLVALAAGGLALAFRTYRQRLVD
ncbi:ABC transporter permease [Zhihengliuella salsuginis]|uniref:Transport permease protein n=1 Tax=Zhihengliuella salsuginis TaxID=578222 RepID=A0ABQ3GJA0_9MICC|nr:ABC transporter permease [Zhihengliuella salsuginis]GHD09375.1 transport permease protein [Zhihengliuella salsuginis]